MASQMRDQDLSFESKVSQRSGAVWAGKPVQLGDASPASVPASIQSENLRRRKEAAAFIQDVGGVAVQFGADNTFRQALADGVLLCTLADYVWPNSDQVSTAPTSIGKVAAFLAIAQRHVPPAYLFSFDDLSSSGWEDRPQVANCILFLKHICVESGKLPQPLPPHSDDVAAQQDTGHAASHGPASDFNSPAREASMMGGESAAFMSAAPAPAASSPPPPSLASMQLSGIRASSGVQRLMQQCSLMLQQHMGDAPPITSATTSTTSNMTVSVEVQQQYSSRAVVAPPQYSAGTFAPSMPMGPASSTAVAHRLLNATSAATSYGNSHGGDFDAAMGPVLESVLSGLTQEYEKRLLAKDHEITDTKERMSSFVRQMAGLHSQLSEMSAELEAYRSAEQEVRVNDAAIAELQAQVTSLQAQLASSQAAHDALAQRLAGLSGDRSRDVAELEARLAGMGADLAAHEGLQSRYRSVQDECRRLYNQVQDLRGAIRVFCRVRPLGKTGDAGESCVEVGLDGELAVFDQVGGTGSAAGSRARKAPVPFKFDRVFDSASTQSQVYEDTQPLIRSVLDGFNVCIFAYGQTGSGKTHTMSGTNVEEMEGRGINYRALDDLFEMRDARAEEVSYTIRVQMLEIYNERLRDLLAASTAHNTSMDILNTQASGCNVPNAVHARVSCSSDVLRAMAHGAGNRATAETAMNQRSSRSHQILTVIVDGTNRVSGAKTHGCLHLVDLAGSERVDRSGATGERLEEAKNINSSLSALGDVMAALASKSSHVPFRNSKLTQLLQDSLSGNAKVMMFMHIAPETASMNETISTLKFGARVSEISLGQAKANVQSTEVLKAQDQVMRLKSALTTERDARVRLEHENEALKLELQRSRVAALAACAPSASEGSFVTAESQRRMSSPGDLTATSHQHIRSPALQFLRGNSLTPVPSPLASTSAQAEEGTPPLSSRSGARLPGTPSGIPAAPPIRRSASIGGADGMSRLGPAGGSGAGFVGRQSDGGAMIAPSQYSDGADRVLMPPPPPPSAAALSQPTSARQGGVLAGFRRCSVDSSVARGAITAHAGSVYLSKQRSQSQSGAAPMSLSGLPAATSSLALSRDSSVGSGSTFLGIPPVSSRPSSSGGAPASAGGRRATMGGGGRWM